MRLAISYTAHASSVTDFRVCDTANYQPGCPGETGRRPAAGWDREGPTHGFLNYRGIQADLWPMKSSGQSAVDLVPLGERMRMISAFRAGAVALILVGWLVLPSTRGSNSFFETALISLGYLGVTLVCETIWRRSDHPMGWIFGVVAMADSLFLGFMSYGTGGLASPLIYLILLQLITVCLLASFKTGVKLALFNSWLLLFAVYLQEAGALDTLGGQNIEWGDVTYRIVLIDISLFFLVTIVTTTFAAINERELRRRRYDLEELAQFALRLEEASGPDGVAETLLAGISEIYACEPSTVIRRDQAGLLRALASRGLDPEPEGRPGVAILNREEDAPVVSKAMADDATMLVARRGRDEDAVLSRFSAKANIVIIPLRGDHGVVVGALVAEQPARRGSRIERRILAMMERFASHGSLAIENAYLLAEVRELTITDPLTGLANRRHLDSVLDQALTQAARGNGTLALLMVDIDHFKSLNDTYGHQTGDDVLRLVAQTLARDLRAGDLAARYGGEEFSIVMPGATGPEVSEAAERIREAVTRIEHEVSVTISIGVAWAPQHGVDRVTLTEAADGALYTAKHSGRNRVALAPVPVGAKELQ
jgi:diguanylate cyclase (GGDEF)-like protein